MMHVMMDLETMGTRPDAPIVSIGAVGFDKTSILREFHAAVDLGSAIASGAVVDASTIMWWLQQSDEARAALVAPDPYSIVGALTELSRWIDWDKALGVWGNGATFDNVILRQSYHRTAVACPWPFWKDRCYRTVKSMYPTVALERSGTHHKALDDARSQALHLIEINKVGNFL